MYVLALLIVSGWALTREEKHDEDQVHVVEEAPEPVQEDTTEHKPPLVGSQVTHEVTIRKNGQLYKRIFYPDGHCRDIKIDE